MPIFSFHFHHVHGGHLSVTCRPGGGEGARRRRDCPVIDGGATAARTGRRAAGSVAAMPAGGGLRRGQ